MNVLIAEENEMALIIQWKGKQPQDQQLTHVICSIYPKINYNVWSYK